MYTPTRLFTELTAYEPNPKKEEFGKPGTGVPIFICDTQESAWHSFIFELSPVHVFVINDELSRNKITNHQMVPNYAHGVIALAYGLGLAEKPGQVVLANPSDPESMLVLKEIWKKCKPIYNTGNNTSPICIYTESKDLDDLIGESLSPIVATGSFEHSAKQRDGLPLRLHDDAIYIGDKGICDPEAIQAYYDVAAINAGSALRMALPKIDGASNEEELQTSYRAVMVGCDELCEMYPKSETPRFENALKKLERLEHLGLAWKGQVGGPTVEPEGEFKEHLARLVKCVRRVHDARRLWDHALENTGLSFGGHRDDNNKMDVEKVCEIGNFLGVDKMMELYLDGVPIDDIIC